MLALQDPSLLRQACFIAGAWTAADDGETRLVTNPATGEVIARVPRCGEAETRRAITAASSPPRSRPSAGSRAPASAARARSTVSMNTWR